MSKVGAPDNWIDDVGPLLARRPELVDEPIVVEVQLTDETDARARWRVGVEAVRIEDPADVVVLMPTADLVAWLDGSAPLPVAFMRGTTKVSGDPRAALRLMKAAAPA